MRLNKEGDRLSGGMMEKRRLFLLSLTPVFIGSGDTVEKFETVVTDTHLYILDSEILFEELYKRGVTPEEIFSDMIDNRRTRESRIIEEVKRVLMSRRDAYYKMEFHSRREGRLNSYQLKLFIKTNGKPFIPGSSLKGAFRTALLYKWASQNIDRLKQLLIKRLPSEKKKADNPIENAAFVVKEFPAPYSKAPDSNKEILRVLKVRDSRPLKPEDLFVTEAYLSFSYSRIPLFFESLKPLTFSEVEVAIDPLVVFEGKLSFSELFAAVNEFSRAIIEKERERVRGVSKAFWKELEKLLEQVHLLRLGGNIGWYSNTIGILLKYKIDGEIFENLRKRYGLGRKPRGKGLSKNFPKTYRLAHYNGHSLPFGWVAVSENREKLEEIADRWEKFLTKNKRKEALPGRRTSSGFHSRGSGFTIGDYLKDKLDK